MLPGEKNSKSWLEGIPKFNIHKNKWVYRN